MHKKLSLKERDLISESLNSDNMNTMTLLVKRALIFTFIVEFIGMIIFSILFIPEYGISEGLFKSLFTSVSSFCNAGFDVVGMENRFDLILIIPTIILSILGGIGFIVFDDVYSKVKVGLKRKYSMSKIISTLAIHTKVVIIATTVIFFIGWGYILLAEYNNENTVGNMEVKDKVAISAFYSATTRAVGVSPIDIAQFTDGCKIGLMMLMLIGGAPGGTAGGIKVTTIALIFLSIIAFLKGKKRVVLFSREISIQTVLKAYIIVMLYISIIVISTIGLTITEQNNDTFALIMESVGAASNGGMSTGLISEFSDMGKLNIMILMYLGRVGTVSMALAFVLARPKIFENIRYPEGKIVVG